MVLMNSFSTSKSTAEFLKENHPKFEWEELLQNQIPKVEPDSPCLLTVCACLHLQLYPSGSVSFSCSVSLHLSQLVFSVSLLLRASAS